MNTEIMFNFHVYYNEIQRKYRGFIYWLIGMMIYSFLMIAMYDSFADQMDELMAVFGETLGDGFLAIFASSSESLATYEGFFSIEYVSVGLIIGAVYGTYLGASTLGKEISNKSIAFILSKPVSRISTYVSKLLGIATALFIATVILAITNILGTEVLSSKAEVEPAFYIAVYSATYLYTLLFVALGQALAVILNDGKALVIGVTIGIASLLMNFLKTIDSIPEEVQYLNPQYYIDIEGIGSSSELPETAWLLLLFAVIISVVGAIWYKRRDINV